MGSKPTVRHTTAMAAMNISPPMVGVPDLDMCQRGPSSRMACPAFILRRNGTRKGPMPLGDEKGYDEGQYQAL